MRFGRGHAPAFTHRTGSGVPKAHLAAERRRYFAMLREARDILPALPGPGESLHALMTGYYDLMTLLAHVVTGRDSPCECLRLATLAFSPRNVVELCRLKDDGRVKSGLLLCSDFYMKHHRAEFGDARKELAPRGIRLAVARSHCKVALLHFGDGLKLALEGSANLRTNRNAEQFALHNDGPLHDWHASWMEQRVRDYEVECGDGSGED